MDIQDVPANTGQLEPNSTWTLEQAACKQKDFSSHLKITPHTWKRRVYALRSCVLLVLFLFGVAHLYGN